MKNLKNQNIMSKEKIPVEVLLKSPAKLNEITSPGTGASNNILDKNLYRPQLALAGYVELFTFKRVQIFGNTEIYYLQSLSLKKQIEALENIFKFQIPCIVLTNNHKLPPEIIGMAEDNNVPIFSTEYDTTKAFSLLSEFLDDQFATQTVVHGSFVDVYGVGMLFVGRSGIGKSEIALDLVERGHRLVADDVVMLTKKRQTILMGTGTSMVQHFMEIRGLGIIDIRQMFGIRSIRFQKRLEIIVELVDWSKDEEYTRTGLDETPFNIMDIEISNVKLPIFSGKNITVIAEVIALNYLLRTYGYNASEIFSEKLSNRIKQKSGPNKAFEEQRIISYLQGDSE